MNNKQVELFNKVLYLKDKHYVLPTLTDINVFLCDEKYENKYELHISDDIKPYLSNIEDMIYYQLFKFEIYYLILVGKININVKNKYLDNDMFIFRNVMLPIELLKNSLFVLNKKYKFDVKLHCIEGVCCIYR